MGESEQVEDALHLAGVAAVLEAVELHVLARFPGVGAVARPGDTEWCGDLAAAGACGFAVAPEPRELAAATATAAAYETAG
jgi:hypothetical protein